MLLVITIMRNAFDPVINKSTVLKSFIRNKIKSYDLLHSHLKLNIYKYRLKTDLKKTGRIHKFSQIIIGSLMN